MINTFEMLKEGQEAEKVGAKIWAGLEEGEMM